MADPLGFLASVLRGTVNGATEAGQGLVQGAMDAATLPRDVYQGKVQTDPRYMSDEEFARTLNLAGNVAGGGITTGVAPEGAIGMFAGQKSRTFPSDKAMSFMEKNMDRTVTPDDIYGGTGIFRGVDGKMRYEIPDTNAAIKPDYLNNVAAGKVTAPTPLRDVLDHPELFKAYPELGDLAIHHKPGMDGATFVRYENNALPPYVQMDMTGKGTMGTGGPLSTFLHETQHAVQNIEGFANGATPNIPEILQADPIKQYRNAANSALAAGDRDKALTMNQWHDRRAWETYAREAGEVEARAVQRRMDYTDQERRLLHPVKEESYKPAIGEHRVPADQQWIRDKKLPFGVEEYSPNLPFLAQYLGK
jgi:hypothetical protein